MVEQLFFITFAIILFAVIFFKFIKKNDTAYVPVLSIQAFGIAIDFIVLVCNLGLNMVIRFFIYTMSIILPIIIILLEKKNIDVMHTIKIFIADFYISVGNFKKAKTILIEILDKNNENYDVHKKLAKIYEKEGGNRKAIDEYVQCIDLNKQDYDSYYKVSKLLTDLDRKPEAIQMLNSLLAKKPGHLEVTIDLGDLLIEQGLYKDAAAMYLESMKYNPMSFDLNYNLGIAYTMLNDFKSAKECYEKAAEINNLAYNAKYCLAEIALIYKDLEKAESYFMQVLDNEELGADCYFELAKINIMKGNKDIAIKYANLAIDLDSKKISNKIKKEPLFMTIRTKISIPFNLEEKEDMPSFAAKERLAKNHLEDTTELTTNMGYANTKFKDVKQEEIEVEEEKQKE